MDDEAEVEFPFVISLVSPKIIKKYKIPKTKTDEYKIRRSRISDNLE